MKLSTTTLERKAAAHPDEQAVRLETTAVLKALKKVNTLKAAGPDNIPGWLIKECADQLAPKLNRHFQCFTRQSSPLCFKSAKIILVPKTPKKSTIACLNDFCPVTLASTISTSFESSEGLHYLHAPPPPSFDPFQFACQPNRCTENAISTALHMSMEHLEEKNTH